MKMFLILILSGASAFGANTDVNCISTSRTNADLSVTTKAVFTRAGSTNLVRNTRVNAEGVQIQVHRFYHDGSLVGMLTETPKSSSINSEPGTPYAIDLEYEPPHQLKYAAILQNDGIVIDLFTCTNGYLFPVESSKLVKAADEGREAQKLISGAKNDSPTEFNQKVERLIKNHEGN